jgi:hypothetical protein
MTEFRNSILEVFFFVSDNGVDTSWCSMDKMIVEFLVISQSAFQMIIHDIKSESEKLLLFVYR